MRRPANRQVTQQKLRRIQLVARVRIALDQLREVVARRSGDPAQARASITTAQRRLSALNRALALLALGT